MSGERSQRWEYVVLDHLDAHADEIVASLSRLVRIPSVSGSDAENDIQVALRDDLVAVGIDVDHWQIPLAETMADPGFPGVEVDRDEAWGLVGAVRGSGDGRSLLLDVHVDVVPPSRGDAGTDPFSGRVDAAGVHGRGSCDMKGGVVAALWVARTLAALEVPLRGDLLLACVQGEEDGGLGTFATLRRGWRADACVIPEPTSLDLVPASAGSLTFRLRVPGAATHASRRSGGVSAVEKFIPVFQALRGLEAARNTDPDALMSGWPIAYPIEIGTVHAGNWASSVPDLLVAEGRYGVALDEDVDAARREFTAAVARTCAADPWLRDHPVEVEWWGGQFASGRTPVDTPIVATLRRAHADTSAHVQQTRGVPYGSDLRLLTGIGGVPTVHYGPGDAGRAHGPREFVPVDEVLTTARTLALVALRHCGTR